MSLVCHKQNWCVKLFVITIPRNVLFCSNYNNGSSNIINISPVVLLYACTQMST